MEADTRSVSGTNPCPHNKWHLESQADFKIHGVLGKICYIRMFIQLLNKEIYVFMFKHCFTPLKCFVCFSQNASVYIYITLHFSPPLCLNLYISPILLSKWMNIFFVLFSSDKSLLCTLSAHDSQREAEARRRRLHAVSAHVFVRQSQHQVWKRVIL